MMEFSIQDISKLLPPDTKIEGDVSTIKFNKVLPLNACDETSLCWLSPTAKNKTELLQHTLAKIIICHTDEVTSAFDFKVFIKVANPRLVFARIVRNLFVQVKSPSIHPTAIIHAEAIIGDQVYIGPNCVIGKCIIGDGSSIEGNTFIFDHTRIGKNVHIMPNCTIGGVGFGYERNELGEFELFPHIGGIVIEDNVEIGGNTCIDRGTLGDTIIGKGTKIDNLVHISHNVSIGKNCAIIAHSIIGGSSIIGDGTWVAPAAIVRDGLKIGQQVTIGLGGVVLKNIPDSEVWIGNPAKKYEVK